MQTECLFADTSRYADFGITHDNDSLYEDMNAAPPKMKPMPILGDLYKNLQGNKMTERIAVILSRFVTGSAQSFNRQTNVDLSNKFIVIDLSELKGKLLPVGMVTTEEGWIRLSVSIEYFYDAGDKDAIITEEVSNHPELMDMMGSREDEEKEIIMNDPKLRAIIERLAEGTGLSPEEYYDQFDAMLKDRPEIFDEILSMGLDSERKRQKNDESD